MQLRGEPWNATGRFDHIYLLTPIWGSNLTPAMHTFLLQADLKGKKVTAVTFQADEKGAGSEKVHGYMKELVEQRGGKFLEGFALHSAVPGKFAGKEYIEKQVDNLL